ncbi:unnamed protein product [Thelazia callipaeda]|uniref:DUF4174 domain-containing protein n=1 Tax=Thelazia callipaeda TaxID=103827 RepID=A0A0N5D1S6_THECL|nr:unnamed protein product [Thelazia callipaeda]
MEERIRTRRSSNNRSRSLCRTSFKRHSNDFVKNDEKFASVKDFSDTSYESDQDEIETTNSPSLDSGKFVNEEEDSNMYVYCVLLFVLICVAIVVFILNPSSTSSKDADKEIHSKPKLKKYAKKIAHILKNDFPNDYKNNNTQAVLGLIGERLLTITEARGPVVVLVAGSKADTLADSINFVFLNITGNNEVSPIFCNEKKKRNELEREIKESLSKNTKSIVLHEIHKLREDAPLALHSFCDQDHSPFYSSLFLLTVKLHFGIMLNCEDGLYSHLLEVWNSDFLNEDQIRPILSRIFSFVICLRE